MTGIYVVNIDVLRCPGTEKGRSGVVHLISRTEGAVLICISSKKNRKFPRLRWLVGFY